MSRRQEALALAAKINHDQGAGTLVLGSQIRREMAPRCTTGSLAFDVALGGGWPMNQWVELVGNESSGKTAIVLKAIAANQVRDPDWLTFWVDAEGSYDKKWAAQLGVDNDRVLIMNDNSMEKAYNATIQFLDSQAVDAVVIDSLPALVPDSEEEGAMEEFQVGLGARLTGKFFRKQRAAIKRSLVDDERPVLGVMINQWREKIGILFGDPRTTPGGRGKNFFYVVRAEVKREEWIIESKEKYGQVISLTCFKNKSGVPQRSAKVDFYFDHLGEFEPGDYDLSKDVINTAVAKDIIQMGLSGMYTFGDRKWRGRPKMIQALRSDPQLLDELRMLALQGARPPVVEAHAVETTPVKRAVTKKAAAPVRKVKKSA